jgi:hypothetical protein
MLTSSSLENFKSWKRIDKMRLAPITGPFGATRSAKTSILQLTVRPRQTKPRAELSRAFQVHPV